MLNSLAEFSDHCAAPELCNHLHVYQGEKVLLQWHDAFAAPLFVAQQVPVEQVEQFCAELGLRYKEGVA